MSLFKTNDPMKLSEELSKPRQFWDNQPVPKLKDFLTEINEKQGPLEEKKVEEVRKEGYLLPGAFEWFDVDLEETSQMEQVYTLLVENYVEDDDNMFRFDYSQEFLKWALLVPGQFKDWLVGVRVKTSHKLVGFITAIPVHTCIDNGVEVKRVKMAEVNFLCVHKKMRAHRLAPVLIKEVTRRVNLKDQWQAIYTAGIVIPSPYAMAQYWHRSLNPKKLIECKFSCLGKNQTMSRVIKLYKVNEEPTLAIRPMKKQDISQVCKMLNVYLEQNTKVYLRFSEEDVRHFLLPRDNVIYSYVIANANTITDFVSFYNLPSSVLNNPKYTHIKAAYSYYHVATSVSLKQLLSDALILAKKEGFDVFNALDIMQNKEFISELSFSPGDGFLHYYMYNYQLKKVISSQDVGIVLV